MRYRASPVVQEEDSWRRGSDWWQALAVVVAGTGAAAAFISFVSDTRESISSRPDPKSTNPSTPASVVVNREFPSWLNWSLLGIAALVAIALMTLIVYRIRARREAFQLEKRRVANEEAAFNQAIDRLRERMALPSLIELNRLMLDNYHGIATNQAERSFRSSQRAMFGGFAWLLACFSVGFASPSRNATILVGSLAAVGGALAAFLSKTYLRVYERALQQLNQYFNQPLLNSYYLTAERLVSEISPAERDIAVSKIVDQLLDSTALISGDDRGRVGGSPQSRNGRTGRRSRSASRGSAASGGGQAAQGKARSS